jgi:hypothetical protein
MPKSEVYENTGLIIYRKLTLFAKKFKLSSKSALAGK